MKYEPGELTAIGYAGGKERRRQSLPTAAGDIRISIDRTFELAEVPEALAHVGEGRALGKVVVEVR